MYVFYMMFMSQISPSSTFEHLVTDYLRTDAPAALPDPFPLQLG